MTTNGEYFEVYKGWIINPGITMPAQGIHDFNVYLTREEVHEDEPRHKASSLEDARKWIDEQEGILEEREALKAPEEQVANWVDYGWMLLVEFTAPHSIYLDMIAKKGLDDDSVTPSGLQKYKTMMGGYYLIATGVASDEVVDTVYDMIKAALAETRSSILQTEGIPLEEFVKVLRREEGVPEDRQVLTAPTGSGFLNALERQLWIEDRIKDGGRFDKIDAIEAVMHLEHEEGSYVGWIIGLGLRNSELDYITIDVVGIMSR